METASGSSPGNCGRFTFRISQGEASAGTGLPRCFEYSATNTEASSKLQHREGKGGRGETAGLIDNHARYLDCGGNGITGADKPIGLPPEAGAARHAETAAQHRAPAHKRG